MSLIVSSNRSRAEWDAYVEKPERTSLVALISERPHQPVEVIGEHAIVPSPLAHVIGVDECGAPILDPAKHHLVVCENQ